MAIITNLLSTEEPGAYKWDNKAGKIMATLVSCACRAPKVALRRTKERVPKIFISSYPYLHYKFRSLTVTDKQ